MTPTPRATPYDQAFFDDCTEGAVRSARVIVPLVLDLVGPRSVVDIGCGTGTWLRVFADCGVADGLGVDGDYVDRSRLLIPADRFRPMDLTRCEPLGRRFDLAVCLEVGEHLPASEAPGLVRYLTEAAPVVLFSAAPPGQGGTHHVNERWPAYWQELFAERRFLRLDPIRPQVWRDPGVEWWYKQNTVVYASEQAVADWPKLAEEYRLARDNPFELVFARLLAANTGSPRALLRALPGAVWRAFARRRR